VSKICPNCKTSNTNDSTFCENCGAKLAVSGGMPTLTKVLIVVVIVLVAGLGLVSGMMLMNNQNKSVSNNSSLSNNNSTTTTSTQSNNNQEAKGLISAAEAIAIANSNVQSQGLVAIGAELVNGPKGKYYQVKLAKKTDPTTPVAYCDVDATTGGYLGAYT
jgi:hypothetical protein